MFWGQECSRDKGICVQSVLGKGGIGGGMDLGKECSGDKGICVRSVLGRKGSEVQGSRWLE